MSQIFHNLKIAPDEELEDHLAWLFPDYGAYHILRQSVDARRPHPPRLVYSVEVFGKEETPPSAHHTLSRVNYKDRPVVIIGAGPAGLFAALRLVERGIPCRIFEQGSTAETRLKAINRFWRYGELNARNNVGFGEGGAGLYSDGKLITRIKSPFIPYVMSRLVEFGAPKEIAYLANPHVGSDRIRRLIPKMRARIRELGGEFHFDCKIEDLLIRDGHIQGVITETGEKYESPFTVLACGHSAEDFFLRLKELGVFMEAKPFAMGLRIEHPQELLNKIQYREFSGHPKLGAANYRLADHDQESGVGVYSFCMCPGGYVLSCATAAGEVVSNGMSNYARNSPFANAGIVVSLDPKEHFEEHIFSGLELRRDIEQNAFSKVQQAGGTKELPAQKVTDFLSGRLSPLERGSSPSGNIPVRLDQILPATIKDYLIRGLERFERLMPGFISPRAQVYGVESRTSCPIRITRDPKNLQSLSHPGLFPCGEGAGYAGGITSAACDGIRVAETITSLISSRASSEPLEQSERV